MPNLETFWSLPDRIFRPAVSAHLWQVNRGPSREPWLGNDVYLTASESADFSHFGSDRPSLVTSSPLLFAFLNRSVFSLGPIDPDTPRSSPLHRDRSRAHYCSLLLPKALAARYYSAFTYSPARYGHPHSFLGLRPNERKPILVSRYSHPAAFSPP